MHPPLQISLTYPLQLERSRRTGRMQQSHLSPKQGIPSLPTNYQPISLPSILSKVQERIIHCRLCKYIAPHLPPNQSGFHCKDGTEVQLAILIHHISVFRDLDRTVTACFFDLSKAFDKLGQGLLVKLAHYGASA